MNAASDAQNPYEPPTEELLALPTIKAKRRLGTELLLFVPGAALGLNLGSCVEVGLMETINRASVNLLDALKFFSIFGCLGLGLTLLWRVPRWNIVGVHSRTYLGCFVGGLVFASGVYGVVQLLDFFGFLTGMMSGSDLITIGMVAIVMVFISVETEVACGKLMTKRSSVADPPTQLFPSDDRDS